MRRRGLLALGLMLTACAPPGPTPDEAATASSVARLAAYSDELASTDTPRLYATYALPSIDEQTRLMIEAELGVRGADPTEELTIGAQSAAQVGVARYARSGRDAGVGGRDYDCGSFASAALAQRFFLASGGPTIDPHNLDGDGDGAACEWGTEIRRIAARPAPVPAPLARAPEPQPAILPRATSPTCYTGPRGGTYTITSGGTKDYDGC